ncbi:MAG TPA: hypothetical protein VGB55_03215 [Tepidisphaeraceae bacterium]|jgi:hypothetical protein
MAKGKKGPALFEVIRAAQQKQLELEQRQKQQQQRLDNPQNNVGLTATTWLTSPVAWLKGRHAAAEHDPMFAVTASKPAPVAAPLATPAPTPLRREVPEPQPVIPETDATITFNDPPVRREVPAEPSLPERVELASAPVPSATRASAYEVRAAPPVESFSSDAARRVREEIAAASRRDDAEAIEPSTFEGSSSLFGSPIDPAASLDSSRPSLLSRIPFSYSTGLAAGVALLAVAATIFVLTRSTDRPPVAIKLQPAVLNIGPNSDKNADKNTGDKPAVKPPVKARQADDAAVGRTSVAPAGELALNNTQPAKPQAPASAKRVIGLQYVVLLSFPNERDASVLANFLAENGIAATVERALPGYSPSWYSVISVTGFERIKDPTDSSKYSPETAAFLDKLKGPMEQYSKDSKFKKSFKPDFYTWRAAR